MVRPSCAIVDQNLSVGFIRHWLLTGITGSLIWLLSRCRDLVFVGVVVSSDLL